MPRTRDLRFNLSQTHHHYLVVPGRPLTFVEKAQDKSPPDVITLVPFCLRHQILIPTDKDFSSNPTSIIALITIPQNLKHSNPPYVLYAPRRKKSRKRQNFFSCHRLPCDGWYYFTLARGQHQFRICHSDLSDVMLIYWMSLFGDGWGDSGGRSCSEATRTSLLRWGGGQSEKRRPRVGEATSSSRRSDVLVASAERRSVLVLLRPCSDESGSRSCSEATRTSLLR